MKILVACAAALLYGLAASMALAAEVPFNQAAFDAARNAGQTVAVVFHADWCPTCRAQAPVLKELVNSPEMKSLTLYVADFDTEKTLRAALRVNQQSTIVVFKGQRESARSTGQTQKNALEEFLRGAIS
jgi:thioredoxin 1